MLKNSQFEDKKNQIPLEKEIKSLCKLKDLSNIVKEILMGWVAIRKFLKDSRQPGKAFPSFHDITGEEITFLKGTRSHFETQAKNDLEFAQAVAPSQSTTYDRVVYHSIRLYGTTKGHSLLFPWHIFIEVRLTDDSGLLQTLIDDLAKFSKFRALSNFVDLLIASRAKIQVRRTNLSVQYLQTLVDPHFGTSLYQFPKQLDFAKTLGCSREAIKQIDTVYSNLGVIQPHYLVNMSKLGFHCFRVVHQEPLPASFQPFTLRTYLLCRDSFLSIIWLPPTADLLHQLSSGKTSELTHYWIARNFDQLHAKPEKSWQAPNRLLGETKLIRPPQRGIWFTLTPNPNPGPRSLLDFSLMDQLQLAEPEIYEKLADTYGISEKFVRERLQVLLQEEVVAPFYFVIRIGLNANILVTFEGSERCTEALRNDLLAFPYAEMFFGPEGGKAILKIPEAWIATLLEDVMRLRSEGLDIWAIYAAPIISRWGIPLAEIVQKDEFFGIWWVAEENSQARTDS
ncbi:MAG: hypothetical protein ACE5OZ_07160 [Candidatus Heimdallarchaeota archaeon]